ncbi:MAG: glutaredoxin family protein [Thermoleophilia bacterium]
MPRYRAGDCRSDQGEVVGVDGVDEVRLDFYSAPHCALCDSALAELVPLAAELGFVICVVDISGDPDLERRYRPRIPVAEVAGRTAFKFRVDEGRVRKLVARASRLRGWGV